MTKHLLKTACVLLIVLCSGCISTNPNYGCFPTDDGDLTYYDAKKGKEILRLEKINEARLLSECQPSDQDFNGRWGSPVDGFQMSIRLRRVCFTVGEPIPIEFFIRNVSKKDLSYDELVPDKSLLIELRKDGQHLSPRHQSDRETFRGRVIHVTKQSRRQYLLANTQRKFTYELLDQFDILAVGYYSVRFGRIVSESNDGLCTKVMSGWAQFEVIEK